MFALSGGLTDKQEAVAPYLLALLQKIPNASLDTLRILVGEKVRSPEKSAFASAIAQLDSVEQGFFRDQFYGGEMQRTKDAIGWKLYKALASTTFRKMFGAPRNSFDAHDAMAKKKIVLIKGGRAALDDDGMSVFLQFIIAQFFVAARARENERPAALHPHDRRGPPRLQQPNGEHSHGVPKVWRLDGNRRKASLIYSRARVS